MELLWDDIGEWRETGGAEEGGEIEGELVEEIEGQEGGVG